VAPNQQENIHFSMEKEKRIFNSVQVFTHKRIISAAKRVKFISVRMPYIILRGRWCHVIVLNVHAPTEDKTDDVKDSFYEELEQVFDQFSKYIYYTPWSESASELYRPSDRRLSAK
jgi:isopentenyldiphosphate isomerase